VHELGAGDQTISFGTDVYEPALKDWVVNGAQSKHVQSAATVAGNIRKHSPNQQMADAAFCLGNLFRRHGMGGKADLYWQMAADLNPDSVNFIRQNLTLSEEGSAGEQFRAMRDNFERTGKDYYRPISIES
jgi:hypothetical protein